MQVIGVLCLLVLMTLVKKVADTSRVRSLKYLHFINKHLLLY